MAKYNTEPSEEEEPSLLLRTLEVLNPEEIPQFDLQLAAEQLLKTSSNEPEISPQHERIESLQNELSQYSRMKP